MKIKKLYDFDGQYELLDVPGEDPLDSLFSIDSYRLEYDSPYFSIRVKNQ